MNIKNRIFQTWIVSYAFILVIPIIIGSFVYVQSLKTINDEVNKAHYMSLSQLRSVMDGKFDEMSKISSVIAQNQDIKSLKYLYKTSGSKNIYTITRIQKDLTKFKISNSFIDDIYIYFNNYLFTSTYKYDGDEIKEVSEDKFLLSYDNLTELAHTRQFKNCMLMSKNMGSSKFKSVLVFAQSLYSDGYKLPAGVVLVTVDGDKLMQLLENLKWATRSDVILVNGRNEYIVTDWIKKLPDLVRFEALRKSKSTFHGNIMKTDTVITHEASDTVDLEYVSMMPADVFLQRVQYIKRIIFAYIIVCLLFGITVAYNLAKMNYRPVKNLIQIYIESLGKNSESSKNEFLFMEDSLRSLLEENKSYVNRLKQQKESMRNNVFVKLFRGGFKVFSSFRDLEDTYGIRFEGNNYVVMAVNIERLRDDPAGKKIDEDEMNLIYFIIKNVFEELVNEKYIGYTAEVDGRMACLVNFSDDGWNKQDINYVIKDIMQIADKGNSFIENKFNIVLSVAVSNAHYGIQEISKAYSEVLEVFEYKTLVDDEERIICYNNIHLSTGIYTYGRNLEKERQFINCIKTGDYKNAAEILDNIITNDFRNNKSLQLVKCAMSGLINSMLNAIGEIMTEADMEFFDKLDPAKRLLNAKTVTELKSQVNYIFDNITDYFTKKVENETPEWIEEIEEFAKMHFQESGLSITSISEKFNLSVSYLSRTYKKYRGIGLLDYIQRMRLNKAKELLNDERRSLSVIAEKVGLLESKALCRLFKRYEGTTPGRFRDI